MELFLPGLLVLVLAAFFAFLVLPRMGTPVLIGVSITALLLAAWHHYYMFSTEYKLSTWQDGLSAYAPWVIILLSFFFVINFVMGMRPGASNQPSVIDNLTSSIANSTNTMPSASSATNSLTAGINSAINSTKNIFGLNKNRNSPMIPGLGFSGSQV